MKYASVILLLISLLISGCSALRGAVASLKSTEHFIILESEPRVLYEPGAQDFAEVLAQYLPGAIEQVESRQYRKFSSPVLIYACSSLESFFKLTGQGSRAAMLTGKAFFSPRLLETPEEVPKILAHELSHLHVEQQIGTIKMSKLPFWFQEGLATYVSDGGGTGKISESDAVGAINSGKHFIAHEDGGLFFRKTPSYWDLTPHMYYRQSMMFISFLHLKRPENFQKLVLEIQNGGVFKESYQKAYEERLDKSWSDFLNTIIKKG